MKMGLFRATPRPVSIIPAVIVCRSCSHGRIQIPQLCINISQLRSRGQIPCHHVISLLSGGIHTSPDVPAFRLRPQTRAQGETADTAARD